MSTSTQLHAFSALIESFQVSKPNAPTNLEHLEIISEVTCDALGGGFKLPPFSLWLDTSIDPGLPGLKEQISLWLVENDHPTSPQIINSLLAVIGAMRQRGIASEAIFERLQKAISESDVSHFFILPGRLEDEGSVCLGGFNFSKLNEKTLEYRCKHAGSDFFEKRHSELRGRHCLHSPIYSRKVINFVPWLLETRCEWFSATYQSVLAYFEALSIPHIKMMWHDFSEKQLIYLALGASLFPNIREIENMLGAQSVTIYLKLPITAARSAGYVVPNVRTRTISFPSLRNKALQLDLITDHYQLARISKAPLYPLLLDVCRSISNASSLAEETRFDESFLASVIALEQVFSERNGITRTISGRTAALVHRQLNLDFVETAHLIVRLYNSRSSFVHEGISIPIEHRLQITPVVKAVAKSLIFLCDVQVHTCPVHHQEWLEHLDIIREQLKKEHEPSQEDMLKAGILEPVPLTESPDSP